MTNVAWNIVRLLDMSSTRMKIDRTPPADRNGGRFAAARIAVYKRLMPRRVPHNPLGEFIRNQREITRLSLRQLANLARISNPYLSQIERGLHEPSAAILKEPADMPFGVRQYTAKDIGGHWWTFSQNVKDVDPAEWGAKVAR